VCLGKVTEANECVEPEVESLSLSLSIEEESEGEEYPHNNGLPPVVSVWMGFVSDLF
jgi:hypothetical protein